MVKNAKDIIYELLIMTKLTISGKNQITMPVEFVRALGLRGGDKLDAELIDGRIVLWPEPRSYTDEFIGSLSGSWGSIAVIEGYVAEERASWHESERDAKAWAFLESDSSVGNAAREIVEHLKCSSKGAASQQDLSHAIGHRLLWPALRRLVDFRIVEDLPELDRDGVRVGGTYQIAEGFTASRQMAKE